MWVEDGFLEDFGVHNAPAKAQAQQFLNTAQFDLVRDIMLSVRPASRSGELQRAEQTHRCATAPRGGAGQLTRRDG